MAKVNVNDLPTLDDFTESKLLEKEVEDKQDPDKTDDDDDDDDKGKDPKNKKTDPKTLEKKEKVDKKADPKVKQKGKPAPEKKEDPDDDEEEEEEDDDPNADPKDPKDKAPGEGGDEGEGNFWDDVQKITGMELEVDFGDVDPESPQGAAIRDQALIEYAVDSYLESLKDKFPRAYKILEHEANGGKIEDLIKPDYVDYSKIELKEDNKEQQKQILFDFYKSKGFDDKKAQRMVEADQDSEEGLFAQAKSALAEKVKVQQAEEERITKEAKLKQQAREQQDTQFLTGVKQIINSGKLGQFNILTKKDKEDFYNFITGAINHGPNDEGYVAVLPIGKENILETLQQLYFGFKKGNLDEFVARTAQTQNVRKLKRNVSKGDKAPGAAEDKRTPDKTLPTFDDYTVN